MTYLVLPGYNFLGLLKDFDIAAGIYTKRHTKQQTVSASFYEFEFVAVPEIGEVIHLQIYFDYTDEFKIGVKGVFTTENLFNGQARYMGSIRAIFVVIGQYRQRLDSLGLPLTRIQTPSTRNNSQTIANYQPREKDLNTVGVVFGGKSLKWLLCEHMSGWNLEKINNLLVINFDNALRVGDTIAKETYDNQILLKVNNIVCLAVHLKASL